MTGDPLLSPLDDLPIHQVAEPVRVVATSDRNFYDRYYFNVHACSGELFAVIGMGQYPNLDVTDAFVAVLYDDVHRVVRASRELGADRSATTVGPIRIDVLEGLRRLRVVCDGDEHGIGVDLMWDAAIPPHREPRHFIREPHGRTTFDSMRFAQTGRWTGELRVDDTVFAVTPDRWWGTRDRSWGVRPVGEPEPPGVRAGRDPGNFFWLYAPMQFDEFSILFIVQEHRDGGRVIDEAVRVWPDATGRAAEVLGRPEHVLEFRPGTRDVVRAVLRMGHLEVTAEPLLPMHLGIGTGYGFDADWRHGMWQGPLTVESVRYDLRDPAVRASMWGIVDSVARFTTADGDVGYGLFEYLILGPHDRYGFAGWDDTA